MERVAFVFSGQGAQYPGMGLELFEVSSASKAVFYMADQIRPGTARQCFEGSKEELAYTDNTQPCLYTVSMAAAFTLNEAGIYPQAAAGFSVGELAAAAYAKALTYEEGFRLVNRRGKLMRRASESSPAAMAAILKLDHRMVEKICEGIDGAYPVNYNCPGQTVVSFDESVRDALNHAVRDAGGKAVPLKVSGGFHSPFMKEAEAEFRDILADMSFEETQIPLYSNLTARPYKGDYAELLARQIINPVLWEDTILNMIRDGIDTFIEVGAGTTLCGLIKKISDAAAVYNVQDAVSLKKTIMGVRERCYGEKMPLSQARRGALAVPSL